MIHRQNTALREVVSVALKLIDGLAGSRSDELKELVANERWDDLTRVKIDPNSYEHPESFFRDYAAASFLQKYEALPTTFDRKKKAVDNFWEAEKCCFRTNQRLAPFLTNSYGSGEEPIFDFIVECRKMVLSLIGEGPPDNLKGRFGPGATFGDKGGLTTIPDKMQSYPSVTREAWPYLFPWSETLWAKAAASRGDQIIFERGDRFTTVSKNCKTDRGITMGPSINIFYQLDLGRAMRKSLKRSTLGRVDLSTAQERHRRVARVASITGSDATVDLTQASDNQSYNYVKLLTPHRWFTAMDDLRATRTLIGPKGEEKWVVLEKFSAMGNGYTFELETVLFLAVCMAVMQRMGHKPVPGANVHVFGDDIIVPTECAREVIAALSFFGFSTNEDKTFISGPFRESCGGDYFLGVDVRPYHLKKEVCEPQDYIGMANGIRRMAFKDSRPDLRWHRLRDAWFNCLDSIPSDIRCCRGPEALGDICIHDDSEFWATRTRNSIRTVRVYKPATYREVKWTVFDPDVQLATAIYGIQRTSFGDGNIIGRDSVTGYKIGWVPYS